MRYNFKLVLILVFTSVVIYLCVRTWHIRKCLHIFQCVWIFQLTQLIREWFAKNIRINFKTATTRKSYWLRIKYWDELPGTPCIKNLLAMTDDFSQEFQIAHIAMTFLLIELWWSSIQSFLAIPFNYFLFFSKSHVLTQDIYNQMHAFFKAIQHLFVSLSCVKK